MAERKKVLLLTYYWPPAGGAGVQRWLKMSKHLAKEFNLTVFHPQNAEYPILDETLLDEIPSEIKNISLPIREPYTIASKLNPKNKTYQKGQIEPKANQSFLSKTSLWIRANMFIPDARAWWIMPSFKYLNKYLKENPQDVIITTGPPHSVHVIGLRLKLRNPQLKWISDFRDPWTDIDYFDKLPLNKSALKKHEKLEKEVLKYADIVTTVSPTWAEDLSNKSAKKKEVKVIYNGYDKEDFIKKYNTDKKFTITYVGSLNDDRNPSILWEVLNELCLKDDFNKEFELQLIGHISEHVKNEIISLNRLKENTQFISYLPHGEAIKTLQKSQILLLLINNTPNQKGIIPGKVFEYLASNRRILCFGNQDSDIAQILHKTKAGTVIDRTDDKKMKQILNIWFQQYKKNLLNQNENQHISNYSRKQAACNFIQLIENI